jgi:hypothetical protein
MKYSSDFNYKENIEKGLKYYLKNFFTEGGMSKYYNNSIYPIDIHAPAQLVITLSRLNRLDENRALADSVLTWTIKNMQSKHGYFFYQRKRLSLSRIPYIRWSQAWMFFALSEYFKNENK